MDSHGIAGRTCTSRYCHRGLASSYHCTAQRETAQSVEWLIVLEWRGRKMSELDAVLQTRWSVQSDVQQALVKTPSCTLSHSWLFCWHFENLEFIGLTESYREIAGTFCNKKGSYAVSILHCITLHNTYVAAGPRFTGGEPGAMAPSKSGPALRNRACRLNLSPGRAKNGNIIEADLHVNGA